MLIYNYLDQFMGEMKQKWNNWKAPVLTLCRVTVCCSHITVSSIAALCIRTREDKQSTSCEIYIQINTLSPWGDYTP